MGFSSCTDDCPVDQGNRFATLLRIDPTFSSFSLNIYSFYPYDKTWALSLAHRLALRAGGGYDRPLQSVGHRHERDSPSPAVVGPKAWLRMKAGPADTEDSDAGLGYQDCISRMADCVPAAQPKQALNCPNNTYSGESIEIQEASLCRDLPVVVLPIE